jgi:hypothetical protein
MVSSAETGGWRAGDTCDDVRARVNGPVWAKEEVEASYVEHCRFNGVGAVDGSDPERLGDGEGLTDCVEKMSVSRDQWMFEYNIFAISGKFMIGYNVLAIFGKFCEQGQCMQNFCHFRQKYDRMQYFLPFLAKSVIRGIGCNVFAENGEKCDQRQQMQSFCHIWQNLCSDAIFLPFMAISWDGM